MLANKLFSRWNMFQRIPWYDGFFVGVAFILLVPTLAHLLFSHLGFNPTDDGFILAGSRRILDGQVPHRDFISIRTAGSHFIHVPFVLFGGDYVFWISRYFAWFQFACIAWVWTVIISHSFGTFRTGAHKFAFALIAFCFSAHCFPIMVWHSIDALFMASIGIMLCHKQSNLAKMVGYLLIGMSPLFRQNFVLLIPASIIIFNDWRQKRYWLVTGLPVVFYICYLAINGAMSDFFLQLSTYTYKNALMCGVVRYILNSGTAWGILVGYLATYMAYNKFNLERIESNTIWLRVIGISILFGIPLSVAGSLAIGGWIYIAHPSFAVFGAVVGAIMYLIYKEQRVTTYIRCGVLILITAWSVSISIGYNTPALALGPLVLFLIACGMSSCQLFEENKPRKSSIRQYFSQPHVRTYINILTVLLLIATLIAFGIARENYIYRDMSAPYLTHDLGEVLPGAKLIKTNPNTYSFLKDLQVAKNIAKEEGKVYCIIPDVAANWVKSSQTNPLSIDWPQNTELGRQELVDRIIEDLEAHRGGLIVIVQKYQASSLASGFTPLPDSYTIVQYVRSNFNKTKETPFFELYE